jgi:hypothetical protein
MPNVLSVDIQELEEVECLVENGRFPMLS